MRFFIEYTRSCGGCKFFLCVAAGEAAGDLRAGINRFRLAPTYFAEIRAIRGLHFPFK